MVTLFMSKESPGRELQPEELPEGCESVGPGDVFQASDAWYAMRRHWPSLSVVDSGELDPPVEGELLITPALASLSHPEPPPRAVTENDARDLDLGSKSLKDLKVMCRDLNLKTNGSKAALRERLRDHLEG